MLQTESAGMYLELGIFLQVDLLKRVHVAQHPWHPGEAVLLEANCPKVRKPGQAQWQAIVLNLIVGQIQDAEAGKILYHAGDCLQFATVRDTADLSEPLQAKGCTSSD